MNDEDLDPPLDPAEEARVRALLADLSGSGDAALPPEVGARLDETLAGLVAEQQADRLSEERPATGSVVPLRPRWLPRAAAAAAAVIVLGAGGVAAANLGLLGGGGGSASSDSSAGSASSTSSAQSRAEAPPSASAGSEYSSGGEALGALAVPQLRAATFDADVRRLLGDRRTLRLPAATPGAGEKAARTCPGPAPTDGSRTLQVTYAGQPAALVVHPSRGGHRLVEAWSCSGGRRLASTTVAP